MSIAVNVIEPRLLDVHVTDDEIIAHLIIGDGQGIHWPDIDEDISVEGMLCGSPARRPKGLSKPQGAVTVSS